MNAEHRMMTDNLHDSANRNAADFVANYTQK